MHRHERQRPTTEAREQRPATVTAGHTRRRLGVVARVGLAKRVEDRFGRARGVVVEAVCAQVRAPVGIERQAHGGAAVRGVFGRRTIEGRASSVHGVSLGGLGTPASSYRVEARRLIEFVKLFQGEDDHRLRAGADLGELFGDAALLARVVPRVTDEHHVLPSGSPEPLAHEHVDQVTEILDAVVLREHEQQRGVGRFHRAAFVVDQRRVVEGEPVRAHRAADIRDRPIAAQLAQARAKVRHRDRPLARVPGRGGAGRGSSHVVGGVIRHDRNRAQVTKLARPYPTNGTA